MGKRSSFLLRHPVQRGNSRSESKSRQKGEDRKQPPFPPHTREVRVSQSEIPPHSFFAGAMTDGLDGATRERERDGKEMLHDRKKSDSAGFLLTPLSPLPFYSLVSASPLFSLISAFLSSLPFFFLAGGGRGTSGVCVRVCAGVCETGIMLCSPRPGWLEWTTGSFLPVPAMDGVGRSAVFQFSSSALSAPRRSRSLSWQTPPKNREDR